MEVIGSPRPLSGWFMQVEGLSLRTHLGMTDPSSKCLSRTLWDLMSHGNQHHGHTAPACTSFLTIHMVLSAIAAIHILFIKIF